MSDANYLALQSATFEPAIAGALKKTVAERAPNPVARVGELLLQAAAPQPPLTLPKDAPRQGGQWDLLEWTRGAGVHRVVAAALQEAAGATKPGAAPDAALSYLKGIKDRGELQRLLCTGAVVSGLVDLLWGEVQTLQAAGAATGTEIASKFAGAVEMAYSGLETFFGGLEGVVGAPDPHLLETMKNEHTEGHDATREFTTGNYGLTTTSAKEWSFVVDEAAPDGTSSWPVEAEAKLPDRDKCRKKTPLAELETKGEAMNAKLEESNQPVILVEEIIAANLYTGPVRRARARLSP